MQPYWINPGTNGRLAIVPQPRGGDCLTADLAAIRREGVDILVSLLTLLEVEQLGLLHEPSFCKRAGLEFLSFAICERGVPTSHRNFYDLAEMLATERRYGKNIAAHCRAGIGRSSLLLAAILCVEGISPDHAFRLISKGRGVHVPDTEEQAGWICGFANSLPRC